jgi:hypothetical protein
MIFKHIFLHLFATLSALKQLLRTIIDMHRQISLLDPCSTIEWALNFKLSNDLLKTHVRFKSTWECFLATWAVSTPQCIEALLTYDGTTLLTIVWQIW